MASARTMSTARPSSSEDQPLAPALLADPDWERSFVVVVTDRFLSSAASGGRGASLEPPGSGVGAGGPGTSKFSVVGARPTPCPFRFTYEVRHRTSGYGTSA